MAGGKSRPVFPSRKNCGRIARNPYSAAIQKTRDAKAVMISMLRRDLAQHVRQNSAVAVVVNFDAGINARFQLDALLRARRAMNHHRDSLLRLDGGVAQPEEIICLAAVQLEGLRAYAVG